MFSIVLQLAATGSYLLFVTLSVCCLLISIFPIFVSKKKINVSLCEMSTSTISTDIPTANKHWQ